MGSTSDSVAEYGTNHRFGLTAPDFLKRVDGEIEPPNPETTTTSLESLEIFEDLKIF